MTQSPSPYMPPSYAPSELFINPSRPGRRAAILMFVVGGLGMIWAASNIVFMLTASDDSMRQFQQGYPSGAAQPPMAAIKACAIAVAGLIFLVSLALVILGFPVFRGRRGATIASLITVASVAVILALMFVLMLLLAVTQSAILALPAMFLTVPLGLLIWQVVWLVAALKSAARPDALLAAQQMYFAQYHQYQQEYQAYASQYGQPAGPQQAFEPPPPPPGVG